MKKVKLEKLLASLAISMILVVTTSCEKKEVNDINPIVGIWTLDALTLDYTINGVSYVDYLVAELGYTQEEAEIAAADFTLSESPEVLTLEFKGDGTFVVISDGDETTGTWTLVGEVLSITDETDPEVAVFDIITLTNSSLVIQISMSENWDFNGDGTDEVVAYNLSYSFTR